MNISRFLGFVSLCVATACTSPNTRAINNFAGGLDAASVSVLEAFDSTNRFVFAEHEIDKARVYALREQRGPDGTIFVNLAPPDPRIPDAIIFSRRKALEGFRGYARLLIELSDGKLTKSFAAEMDGLGGDLKSFQGKLGQAGAPEQISGFDFGPLVTALNIMGQKLIKAKAASAISKVALDMQPQIEVVTESLLKDIAALDEILAGRRKNLETSLETVLVEESVRSSTERFAIYREYAALYAAHRERRGGLGRLERALRALPKAHAAITDPKRDDLDAAVATFLRFADLAADFYANNFKEQ